MYKYLPSRKFSLILLSIVAALSIIWAFPSIISLIKQKSAPIKPTDSEARAKVQEFMALDSDHDGLPDWEEVLYKTDPKNPDTDGDGTSDGEEVRLNRDPLKANTAKAGQEPNDKIDEKIIAADKKATDDFTKLSTTEKIGRELFSQYIATRQVDSPLTDTQKQQIITNAISNLPDITLKSYAEKDIRIINSADNETLKNYSNAIAGIILTNLKTQTENVDDIITDFSNIASDTKINEQTKEIFKRFDPLIAKNKKTVDDLLNLSVPQILLTEHLDLLNSFQEIYESLDLMQKSATDVITLIPVLNHYDLSVQNLADSLTTMTIKNLALKIIYPNKTDYGYQLFNVIMLKPQ